MTSGVTAPVPPLMTITADPPDLARPHWWSRFPGDSERAYRTWLVPQMVPVCQAILAPSLLLWLILPVLGHFYLGDRLPAAITRIELFVNAPTIGTCLLLTLTPWRKWIAWWFVIGIVIVGGATMFATRYLFHVPTGGAATAAVFFIFLCPFVRLPTGSTALVAVLLDGAAAGIMITDIRNGSLDPLHAWPLFNFLGTTLLLVTGSSLVAELGLRRAWVQEQVIARQNASLAESKQLIRRYVPPGVVSQIESGNAHTVDTPVRRRVTILFSDVVGFTDLADRLDPESLTQFINEYLASVAEIIEAHGGTLNEFAGDGFMAIFGAPEHLDPEDQVLAAVTAAAQIHARLPVLNEGWFKLGIRTPIRTRIGINTGVLSVGTFGSQGRATYTAIGLQTNIAARIQAQAEPGTTLLSDASWHLVKDRIACEPKGEVMVKGVHFPIALYAPPAGQASSSTTEAVRATAT